MRRKDGWIVKFKVRIKFDIQSLKKSPGEGGYIGSEVPQKAGSTAARKKKMATSWTLDRKPDVCSLRHTC